MEVFCCVSLPPQVVAHDAHRYRRPHCPLHRRRDRPVCRSPGAGLARRDANQPIPAVAEPQGPPVAGRRAARAGGRASGRPATTAGSRSLLAAELKLRPALRRLDIDLLHSTDFIPPLRVRSFKSVITVHDLAFLRWPHFLTEDSARYYGQVDTAVRARRPHHRRLREHQERPGQAAGRAAGQDHGGLRGGGSDLSPYAAGRGAGVDAQQVSIA